MRTSYSSSYGSRGALASERIRQRPTSRPAATHHLILFLANLFATVLHIHPTTAFSLPPTNRALSRTFRQRMDMFARVNYRRCIASCGRVNLAHCFPSQSSAYFGACTPAPPLATRLFGTKRNTPGNPPGEISIYNEQTALDNIDVDRIQATIAEIRNIVEYPTYDISLLLVDDDEMRQTNLDTRGIDGPTDILSFPFQDVAVEGKPGVLAEPEFDVEDYYSLGDMMLDVAYVMRRCEEDRLAGGEGGDVKDTQPVIVEGSENDAESDNVDDDRGVSGAMSTVFDPEERIHMLLVHGMLHLVGYDHIEDDDYDSMWRKEEEVLELLRKKGLLR